MRCPACEHTLHEMQAGEIKVDICKGGCGGIWLDAFEVKKFDEPHEFEGEALLDIERDENVRVDHDEQRHCPRCRDTVMMRHFWSIRHEVEVDECPKCGGYWLDAGELGHLRSQYESEEERQAAADAYFTDIMDQELAPLREESEAQLRRARKIAHMFRFICPSYYIPGKQSWGAF